MDDFGQSIISAFWGGEGGSIQIHHYKVGPYNIMVFRGLNAFFYVLLGCHRKLGSMVSKWLISPKYSIYKYPLKTNMSPENEWLEDVHIPY